MKRLSCLLLFALATLPAPLSAQRGGAVSGEDARGPIEILMRQRSELGLTEAQVARLEEIRRETEARNAEHVRRLLEIRRETRPLGPPRRMTPEQRRAFAERLRDARPLLERIRRNNTAAMREVREVLTPEQRRRLREMVLERRRAHGPRPRGGPGI